MVMVSNAHTHTPTIWVRGDGREGPLGGDEVVRPVLEQLLLLPHGEAGEGAGSAGGNASRGVLPHVEEELGRDAVGVPRPGLALHHL